MQTVRHVKHTLPITFSYIPTCSCLFIHTYTHTQIIYIYCMSRFRQCISRVQQTAIIIYTYFIHTDMCVTPIINVLRCGNIGCVSDLTTAAVLCIQALQYYTKFDLYASIRNKRFEQNFPCVLFAYMVMFLMQLTRNSSLRTISMFFKNFS